MKIAIIGTGYVGLVSGVCFAEIGNQVVCVDKDPQKIVTLRNGGIPIYEPGLQELSIRNQQEGRLSYTSRLEEAVPDAEIVIIAVGTPPLPNGEADMQYIESAAREIGTLMNGYKVVCTKSTVPVGTNERVRRIIAEQYSGELDIASLPEFLREGTAVKDTMKPDRIVIGTDSPKAAEILAALHSPLTNQIVTTDIRSAEMIKYASNAFLATKISFINEIANICEKVGADVMQVAKGMGMDKRIGASFLKAGIGYGGSCFPKDTKALIQIAGNVEYEFRLLKSVVEVNQQQRFGILEKLMLSLEDLKGRAIGIWGLAFKPETDDVREAPALEIITKLIELEARIYVYDPIAMSNFRKLIDHPSIVWCSSAMEAVENKDALCIMTEWKEFAETDPSDIEAALAQPILIDGRNIYSDRQIEKTGLCYYPVGRPSIRGVKPKMYELI